ncbi:MAG: hypothetical protein IPK15_18530 [Verrucomicrobia bacterium]|nr:hypothetical protein [Verrucomicrobiota bacterium]
MSTKTPECWASDASAKLLRIEVSPEKSLLLKYDQLIHAEFDNAEKEQRLRLIFATHEVIIRGCMLRRIETALQRLELSYLAAVPASFRAAVADGQPVVREIVVTEVKDVQSGTNHRPE